MNILVTGADGQLGNEMRIVSQGSADHYIYTDVAELDITDATAVRRLVQEREINVIINCAAYSNVDQAEEERDKAVLLNTTAVRYLADVMAEAGGLLVHISTDYVFGGNYNNKPCTEDIQTLPTGVYAETKLLGEQAIAESGCQAIILRTAWLYSEFGKNFVKTMLDLTARKPQLKVVYDQCGTPTYALDLARAIFRIVETRDWKGKTGVYHYSGEGVCSWFDFTKAIAEYSGHTACDIQPCLSSEFPSKVIRPSYSVLDKSKFKKAFALRVPYWTEALRECLANMNT